MDDDTTKNKNKRHAAWVREHTTQVMVKLNHNTDADILAWLSDQPSRAGAFKAAARTVIKQEGQQDE